jgi:RNA polymerase sigma-70 factor (ECF subfamily)
MSAEEPDDRALLQAHVAGDTAAFGTLFARHRDRLWAVALRTTGDREEAADALQDAMVSAFRRAGSFRGDAAVTTWLHRIVVNSCLDRLRRRRVRRAEPLPDGVSEDLDPRSLSAPVSPSAAVVDPADLAVDHERRAAVLDALASLPLDQRAALVLVDMEGYSVQEAADILECAPGTVKSRCSRGRARLLPLLLEHRTHEAASEATAAARGASEPRAPTAELGTERPDQVESGNPRAGPRVGPTAPAATQASTTEQEVSDNDA